MQVTYRHHPPPQVSCSAWLAWPVSTPQPLSMPRRPFCGTSSYAIFALQCSAAWSDAMLSSDDQRFCMWCNAMPCALQMPAWCLLRLDISGASGHDKGRAICPYTFFSAAPHLLSLKSPKHFWYDISGYLCAQLMQAHILHPLLGATQVISDYQSQANSSQS